LEAIISDPMKAKMPSDRSGEMVCAYMLSHRIDGENANPVFRYIKRLNIEMQVLAVRALMRSDNGRRAKPLVILPAFQEWLKDHNELIVASQS